MLRSEEQTSEVCCARIALEAHGGMQRHRVHCHSRHTTKISKGNKKEEQKKKNKNIEKRVRVRRAGNQMRNMKRIDDDISCKDDSSHLISNSTSVNGRFSFVLYA